VSENRFEHSHFTPIFDTSIGISITKHALRSGGRTLACGDRFGDNLITYAYMRRDIFGGRTISVRARKMQKLDTSSSTAS
jgi:hypothetical protein